MSLWYNPFYSLVQNPDTNELEGAQLSNERIKIISIEDLDDNIKDHFNNLGLLNPQVNGPDYINLINTIRPLHFRILSNSYAGRYEQYDTVIFQPTPLSLFAKIIYYKFDKRFVNMIRKFDELNVGLSAFSDRKKIYRS
jgi:hypothetical protein